MMEILLSPYEAIGLGGSSTSIAVARRDSVFPEGGEEYVERVWGASKNGSLGARARFGCIFEAPSKGF